MFNVKDILAAVRVCVLGVLLFAPMTINALPANDDHVALPDTEVTNEPSAHDEGQASATGVDAMCNTECERNCLLVYEDCSSTCGGSKWCVVMCTVAHMGCSMGCNTTGPG